MKRVDEKLVRIVMSGEELYSEVNGQQEGDPVWCLAIIALEPVLSFKVPMQYGEWYVEIGKTDDLYLAKMRWEPEPPYSWGECRVYQLTAEQFKRLAEEVRRG